MVLLAVTRGDTLSTTDQAGILGRDVVKTEVHAAFLDYLVILY